VGLITHLAQQVGNRRCARDLITGGAFNQPWWDVADLGLALLINRAHQPDPEREPVIPRPNSSERTPR